MLLNFLRSGLRRRKALGRRKVVWTGISAQEIASNDGQLNFAWVTQYGHLPADEVIYFLPVSPDPAQRAYLSRQSVAWVEPKEAFSILAWRRRLRVAAAVLAALLKSPFAGAGIANVFLARFLCRVSYWRAVVEEFGIDRYFTTTSACWPEAAEVVLLKNLGVKSVTWSYSANSMRIARKAPAFRDVNVTRSLLVTDELWVWNEAHCVYYDKRRVSGDLPAPRIRVTGSMMCGDARSLARDAAAARRLLGIREAGFLLSVFDIATVDDEWRAKFDGGPVAVNLDFAEAFFAGLRALLDALPALVILLKLKRKIGSRFRAFPDSLLQLVADDSVYVKSGRIETVDVNCDPYLPVAACDAAIGMPCTSPVLLAASLGRPAAYFDPLGIAGNIPLANLRGLCIREEGELIERTARWIAGAPEAGPPLPHDVNCTPAWTNERGLFAAHAGC